MTLKQSNHRKTSLALGAFLLLFFSTVFFAHPTSAVGTSKVADYKVGNSTGNTNWHSQGATMSKDYYIWTDWKKPNGPTYIVMCSRSNPSNCWRSKSSYDYGHASTLYHRWGTDFFIVKAVKDVKACWSISQKKPVSMSNCNGLISDIKIGTGITYTHNVAQGYTKYGNYYLRSYGNTPGGNYVTLFDKNLKKLKDVKLPNSINEVEDVMVDGNTGIVYFSSVQYINGKKHVQFFKVAENAFSKWLKPGAGGGADSSGERTPSKSAAREKTASDYQKDSYTPSVSTYDGVVNTIFFGTIQDDGEGCGVYTVLDLVMTILTIGIGVTALIGITISGITYLTAKDNVEKTTKAKRRIYEIVIGLAAYAAIWGILTFLLPEFNPELKACKTLTAEEIAAREDSKSASTAKSNSATSNTANTPVDSECMSKALPEIRNTICQIGSASERIAKTAELLSIPYGKESSQKRFTKPKTWSKISGAIPPVYFQNAYDKYRKGHWKLYSKKYGNVTRVGASCDVFVSTVLKSSGYTKPKGFTHGAIRSKLKDKSKWKVVKKAQRGDVCQKGDKHIRIYLGGGKVAEAQSGASSGVSKFGHIAKGSCKGYTIYRAIK